MCRQKQDIVACLDEIEAYLGGINKGRKCRCGKSSPDCHFDFGWRFCAAWENLKIRLCGHRRR
ncbi:MAG: hypothetical protein IKV89_03500 [Clostridia bacterium]|nr:hypothetical protein [Clostridia bacterium]